MTNPNLALTLVTLFSLTACAVPGARPSEQAACDSSAAQDPKALQVCQVDQKTKEVDHSWHRSAGRDRP